MGSELTVGVLGVGNIGTVHLQSAGAMEGVRVGAAADASAARRARAERLGVDAVYDDYRTLLARETLDAVVVALPPMLHEDATIEAVEAGSHVFVEKPFARTPDEGRRMLDAARRAGVRVGVDHTLRYLPEMRRLKAEYDAGHVGHVPLAVASRVNNGPFERSPSGRVPDWQLDPEATGGGALMDLGVHLLDLVEWFFGPLELRHAELDAQLNLPYEDTASLVLRATETGTIAVVNCGFFQWETPPDVNSYVRLDGVADTLESSEYLPDDFLVHAAKSATGNLLRRAVGAEPSYFGPTYYYRAHFDALADFLTAVRDDRAPPVSGQDGLRAVELVSEAYEAAASSSGPRRIQGSDPA